MGSLYIFHRLVFLEGIGLKLENCCMGFSNLRNLRRGADMEHELIGKKVDVLDHGFVELVDVMGDDHAIAQAARTSTQKQDKTDADDQGLIFRLMRDRHTTPFEMVEFKFMAKMPIFVARQWVRHRTFSINEMSARYSKLPGEFYEPESLRAQSKGGNKQISEGEIPEETEDTILTEMGNHNRNTYTTYEEYLDKGVGREMARMILPLSIYTQWFWKGNLHNLFHFLGLRLAPDAQYEIRVFAEAIADMVKQIVPMAWEAFEEYRLGAVTLSKSEVKMLRDWIHSAPAGVHPKVIELMEKRIA